MSLKDALSRETVDVIGFTIASVWVGSRDHIHSMVEGEGVFLDLR